MTVSRGACCLEGELTILQVEADSDSCNILHAHMLNMQRTAIVEKCCWQQSQNFSESLNLDRCRT